MEQEDDWSIRDPALLSIEDLDARWQEQGFVLCHAHDWM